MPDETPPVVPAVPPVVAPVVAAPALSAGDTVNRMLLEQLTAVQHRAAALEEAERTRLAAQARQEQDLLAEKGNTEAAKQALQAARDAHAKEVATKDGQLAEETRRNRNAFRDREIAVCLSSKPLVEGAAIDLLKLFKDELETHPEGDSYTVRTKDFVSVKDFVDREIAKRPHLLLPTTRGGGGQGGGNAPAPSVPASGVPVDAVAESLKIIVNRARGGAPGLAGNYGLPIGHNANQN